VGTSIYLRDLPLALPLALPPPLPLLVRARASEVAAAAVPNYHHVPLRGVVSVVSVHPIRNQACG
jgi:hypothetical protein